MADQPATTITTEPAPAATPAAEPAATVTEPVKAPSLAEIKAARRAPKAAAQPASGSAGSTSSPSTSSAQPTSVTPAASAGDKPTTAQIDMDGEALKNFTELNRQLREARTKTKNLEDRIAGFGRFEKAQALAKEGKHYDAAKEAGIDVDAALAEILGQQGGAATSTQIDRKLLERLDALEADKLTRDKEADDRKKTTVAASIEEDRKITGKFVTDNATKYPYLAKSPRLVGMAFGEYTTAKTKIEATEGRELTGEENVRLMLATLDTCEAESVKEFGAAAPAAKADGEEASTGLDGVAARAGVRQLASAAPKKLTWDELKRERAAKRAQRATT